MAARVQRLNAICPYFTMFPLEFPLGVLAESQAGQWVLDPFCGRGTTLFAARLCGLGTVGVDVNPVATALAAAKLVMVGAETVIRQCRGFLRSGYEPTEIPEGEFWDSCFHPETLADICRLREQLLGAPAKPSVVALRALMLGILHGPLRKGVPTYLSNQMPRTYATKPAAAVRFWRARDLKPPKVDLLDAVRRRARYSLAELPAHVPGTVCHGDATVEVSHLRPLFSWIITSPPYYGMRTYLPDQWLRAWFLGATPQVEYRGGGQLTQQSEVGFIADLAAAWRVVAHRSVPGARLIIRFGALPSRAKNPTELLTRSIEESEAGWAISALRPSGAPRRGTRQAEQFARTGVYVEEIDCHAVLAG